MNRKEAFKMAMDIDGHMNDSSQGIDLSWDSIEKLVNQAYAKGAAAEREAIEQKVHKADMTANTKMYVINHLIRARGQE